MRRLFLFIEVICLSCLVRGQKGYNYRYWFDDNLSSMQIGALNGNVESMEIPINDLSGWYHNVHFQVQDSLGQWSSTVTKFFTVVSNLHAKAQTYRYWFDDDVTTMRIGTVNSVSAPLEIPLNNLSGWYHNIHFQVRDSLGQWSSTVTKYFTLASNLHGKAQAYRYWFDDDKTTMQQGTIDGVMASLDIPVSSLSGSFHFMHIQVKDSLNQWSSTVSRFFSIVPNRDLTGHAYRYWFDDNISRSITGTMSGNVMTIESNIAALPDGNHSIFMQVKDESDRWSSTVEQNFMVVSEGLTIITDGSGTVTYQDSIICNDAANFPLTSDTPLTLYLTPNEGYIVGNVVLNRTDTITHLVMVDTTDINQRLALNLNADSVMTVEVVFNLTDYMRLGDVNDDGLINVADLAMTVKYIVGGHPKPFILRQADANNDGDVNVGDIVRIVDIITGEVERGKHDAKSHYAKSKETYTNALLTGQIADDILNVNIDKAEVFTSFQMSLSLPEGIDVSDIKLGQSYKLNHQLVTGLLDDGRIKVVVYSPTNSPLLGGNGPLLVLRTNEAILGDVVVDDIVFADNNGVVHKFATMHISASTGVKSVESQIQKTSVHDLGGRRINRNSPLRGIYIVGGKKIIFK